MSQNFTTGSRGVIYIVWEGSESQTETMLARSIDSLSLFHPKLPYHVVRLPKESTLLDKAAMCDLTPYDETLFLDADTVVMGKLDFGFEKAAKHGMAVCICEAPWARRYACCSGDMVEYNCGIIFFTRAARPVFDRWQILNRTVDSSILFHAADGVKRMPLNDQAGFALAVEQTRFNPYVLPMNWNFRPKWHKTWFGPIKIFHDYGDVPLSFAEFTVQQSKPDAIIQYAESGRKA